MDFLGNKEKISIETLSKSLDKMEQDPSIESVDQGIERVYGIFSDLDLEVKYQCENCLAATIDMNFCPFCGALHEGPRWVDVFKRATGYKMDIRSAGGVTWDEIAFVKGTISGAALYDELESGFDPDFLKSIHIKFKSTVKSFWHKYCKCFAKVFIGKRSIKVLFPFRANKFSNPDVIIDMRRPQHNYFSRILIVSMEEVDIARECVLEAYRLRTEQRHRVLAKRAALKGDSDDSLLTHNDDINATKSDGEADPKLHLQEGSEVQGEGVAEEPSDTVREEDHGRSETQEA
jgi:hypothetical protein